MRIVLTSLGSLGDVRPFVALAMELRQHGHDPVFALPSILTPFAQRFGFEVVQLGPDLLREAQAEAMRDAASRDDLATAGEHAYAEALLAALPQALQDLLALCASADLLVSSDIMPLGRFAHDLSGIPFVSVQVWCPFDYPMPDDEFLRNHPLNQIRAQMGLAPLPDPTTMPSPQLALLALSREIIPPSQITSPQQQVTGFFFLEEEAWQPDPALEAFLAAGPAPVLISLGSAMHHEPHQVTKLFVDVVTAAGCRAIIQQGWSGLAAEIDLPETIYAAEYISHNWLFPRVACVVHHGGSGTTATTLRAGVPAIMLPHSGDQFILGQRTLELGATGAVIPFAELTTERLRDALGDVLMNGSYRDAARAVSERVRAEQGVQTARVLIEQLADSLTPARNS